MPIFFGFVLAPRMGIIMNEKLVAAVGSHSSVVLFSAAGVHTVSVDSVKAAENAVTSLVKKGYGIIFLTENYASQLEAELKRYRSSAYPVIISVPEKSGPTGYGIRTIHANMEKAIGTNIFDKE